MELNDYLELLDKVQEHVRVVQQTIAYNMSPDDKQIIIFSVEEARRLLAEVGASAGVPRYQLTWEKVSSGGKNPDVILYRLNGTLIESQIDRPSDFVPLSVIAAIRRYSPELDDLKKAVEIWNNRREKS